MSLFDFCLSYSRTWYFWYFCKVIIPPGMYMNRFLQEECPGWVIFLFCESNSSLQLLHTSCQNCSHILVVGVNYRYWLYFLLQTRGSRYHTVIRRFVFLQRLPLTIPELVHISPTRSTDGLLYTGDILFIRHFCAAMDFIL